MQSGFRGSLFSKAEALSFDGALVVAMTDATWANDGTWVNDVPERHKSQRTRLVVLGGSKFEVRNAAY